MHTTIRIAGIGAAAAASLALVATPTNAATSKPKAGYWLGSLGKTSSANFYFQIVKGKVTGEIGSAPENAACGTDSFPVPQGAVKIKKGKFTVKGKQFDFHITETGTFTSKTTAKGKVVVTDSKKPKCNQTTKWTAVPEPPQ